MDADWRRLSTRATNGLAQAFQPGWRARLEARVDSLGFQNAVMGLILFNAALLGVATSDRVMARWGATIDVLDSLILWFFVLEIGLRIVAKGWRFFRSGWAWFDLIVVLIAFAPSTGGLAALRSLRVLRVLRVLSISPKMRRAVMGLFSAIPGMATVLALLGVIFYVSAVIATQTFGSDPSEEMQSLYGTLGRSFFTLFQLMTLEDWAGGIVLPTMERFPYALLFFLPYIFVTAFAVLNLFIGIIVDAMQDDRDEALERYHDEDAAAEQDRFDRLMSEISTLRAELAEMREEARGADTRR